MADPKIDTDFPENLLEEDTISLRDLELYAATNNSSPRTSSVSDHFEFGFFPDAISQSDQMIVFGGKLTMDDGGDDDDELNEYQKRDYLALVRSSSFRHVPRPDAVKIFDSNSRSASTRADSTVNFPVKCSTNSSSTVNRMNITALTSMSSKSRRRIFMFGPVKFKPEMDLSAIKQRQSRPRAPLPPVEESGRASCARKNHWGLMRNLRRRAHLYAVLGKSFGCIPTY